MILKNHKLSESDKGTPEISSFYQLSEIKLEEEQLDAVKDDYTNAEINVRALLEASFMLYGRSLHHLQLFTMNTFTFPEYMRKHMEAEERLGLTHSQDLLPATWKLYIGIMAVSCYENSYLLVFL